MSSHPFESFPSSLPKTGLQLGLDNRVLKVGGEELAGFLDNLASMLWRSDL